MTDQNSGNTPPAVQNTGSSLPPMEGGSGGFDFSALLRGDIALALGVVAILVVLILTMPSWLLDTTLAFSFAFSVMILMKGLIMKNF